MAELPSGTVTFLFTDIEGSTRLLKQLGERYGDVLAEHDRIMRDAIADAGGQEIDTQGDAFFAAFRRARDAVAAAVAAQRGLDAQEWPEGLAVRVRMGIHTGEPTVGTSRYVGLGVHRGARICSAAHGGQVLLSNTTRDLVEDDLPNDVRVRDLGEHMLKDMDRPERLFQLVVEGVPADFPPPRTAEGQPDALVGGRERELAEAAGAAVARRVGISRPRTVAGAAAGLAIAGAIVAAVVLTNGGSNASAAGIAANSVGLINAKNDKVSRQVDVQKSPAGVAVGAGAVWVTNANDGTVSRIDPETGHVTQTITVGTSPSGIAVGGGSVWVVNHDDGTVSRINPGTNSVSQTITVGNGPTAVAFGAGSVWVTNADDRTVSRIDPDSGDVKVTITTDAVGRGIVVGSGSVWVSDESARSVVRVDPHTNDVVGTVSVGNGPGGVAFGAGAVWVANSLDGTVSRIDPATASVTATVHIGGGPSGIAVGKRAVWVSAEFGERVVKLDPKGATPRVVDSLSVDNRPKGVAVGAGGCWVAVQASGRGHRGGRLVVLADVIQAIDPAVAQSNFGPIVNGLVYDGLTAPRRSGGADGTQLVPDLAATLPAPTDGGKTYTFRLRSGLRYSNGVPVRPADFRRSLERALTLSPDFFKPFNVVGSGVCETGKRCDLSRGILTGAGTVTFKLTAPNPRFLLLLAQVNPVPRGTPFKAVASKPPVGTGPYRVENFAPKRELTLVRNQHFHVWSPAARPDGYPDEIVLRTGAGKKAVDAVARGRADIVLGGAPSEQVPELKARFPSQLHLVPQNATTFLFLNTRQPPFNDLRVRRAVNFAVDRAKVAALHGGADLAQPTCQTIPPDLPGYVRYCPYTVSPDSSGEWKAPDLARARALIAASHTGGEKVVVWTFPFFGKEARYMVSLFRQLGYRARLKELPDIDSYFGTIAKVYPQAGFAGWFGVQIADDVFGTLSCGFSPNWAQFCDHHLDAEMQKLSREEAENSTAARRLAAQLDRTIVDDAPWVPLFTPRLPDFVSTRVGNYQYNIYDLGVLLDQLWVR